MYPRFRAPETMTAAEQAAILRATAASAPRDHVLYSMALGTGLRLSELLDDDGHPGRRRRGKQLSLQLSQILVGLLHLPIA
jgi:site-specific recombinase XerC